MFTIQPTLATEHIRDLYDAADRARLIAQARAGKPTAWQRVRATSGIALTRVAAFVRIDVRDAAPACATC